MAIVTAIVPNYNHERFLERRLSSVFDQTYTDFQVIIIDDRSTDKSLSIINQYKDHPKLKAIVVNERNSGRPILQWLKGIELAETEWIWIAESDDVCELNFLDSLSHVFEDNNSVLALSDVRFINEHNETIKTFDETERGIKGGEEFIRTNMLKGCFVCNSGMAVFRREAAPIAGSWLEQYSFSPDYYFWTMIMQKGEVYTSGKALAMFRKHDAEFTHNRLESLEAESDHANLLYDLFKKGVASKNGIHQVIKEKLISFFTRQKGLEKTYFLKATNIWLNLANKCQINTPGIVYRFTAFIRKIKHRIRTRHAIG